MELLKVDTIKSAREKMLNFIPYKTPEIICKNLLSAQGYILARDIVSDEIGRAHV